MTGFGTKAFTDPDDYRARLAGAEVGLVVTGRPRVRRAAVVGRHALPPPARDRGKGAARGVRLPAAGIAGVLVFSRAQCRADVERPWIATRQPCAACARGALPPARDGRGAVGPDRGLAAGPGALQLRVARCRSIAARRRPPASFGAQLRGIAATARPGRPPGTLQARASGTSRGRPRARAGPDPRPRDRARLGHDGQASTAPGAAAPRSWSVSRKRWRRTTAP